MLDKQKTLFFIGIGGVGMSAIAKILNSRGYRVSGSDRSESDMTRTLSEAGIEINIGHRAENIHPDIQMVVYTNAVNEENPEMKAARALGIECVERADMLNRISKDKYAIGVSGTHGKTTTTSMLSRIMLHAGFDPTLAVGGFLDEIKGSGHEGQGKYFVYEACEAFGSLRHLKPNLALVTNIDDDHLDYYGSLDAVKRMFATYMSKNVPPYGLVIYNKDDDNLREVVLDCQPTQTLSIGIRHLDADFVATDIHLNAFSSEFEVLHHGRSMGVFRLNVPGKHNVYNALLAIVAAHINGVSFQDIYDSLSGFRNANRRFQLKCQREDLTVIDDYAHHPSELNATLDAALRLSDSQHARLIAVFQPHLYSRTEQFYLEFAQALSRADKVVLTEIYPAREENIHNISSRIIFDEVVKLAGEEKIIYAHTLEEVPDKVKELLEEKSIVITLGAGDVWKVSEMFSPGN